MDYFNHTKTLMEKHIFRLSNVLGIRLKVDFKGDCFYVKKIDKTILKGKWTKYSNDYEGQKEFILKVLSKLFKNVNEGIDLEKVNYTILINGVKVFLYCSN